MDKSNGKKYQRDTERAALVAKTAKLCKVSKRHVRYVLSDHRKNDVVFDTYMRLSEGSNELLESVNQLVPFPSTSTSNQPQ